MNHLKDRSRCGKVSREKNNSCNVGCGFTDIYQTLCEIFLVLVPFIFYRISHFFINA